MTQPVDTSVPTIHEIRLAKALHTAERHLYGSTGTFEQLSMVGLARMIQKVRAVTEEIAAIVAENKATRAVGSVKMEPAVVKGSIRYDHG